jgi:hypothetical protein
MPYREPTLRPPSAPSWDVSRVAAVFEAVLDRVASGFERAWALAARQTLRVRLALVLLGGGALGALTGVVTILVTSGR